MSAVQEYINILQSMSNENKNSSAVDAYVNLINDEEETSAVDAYRDLFTKEMETQSTGLKREILGGLTFQTADEIEAYIKSIENGTSYSEEKTKIDAERAEYRYYNPGTAFAAEIVSSIPTGIGLSRALAARGITNLGAQGAIETGAYGFAAGTTPEERVGGAAVGAAFGGAVGAGIQKLVGQPTTPKTTPDTYEVGEIVDYQLADGTTRMAKIVGDENGSFKLTTDLLNQRPSPRKTFSVSKDNPPIFKRFDDELDSGRVTRIERVPEGEETPFTPLSERPSVPSVDVPSKQTQIATKKVADPMPQAQAQKEISRKEMLDLLINETGTHPTVAKQITDWIKSVPDGTTFTRSELYNNVIDRRLAGYDSRNLTFALADLHKHKYINLDERMVATKISNPDDLIKDPSITYAGDAVKPTTKTAPSIDGVKETPKTTANETVVPEDVVSPSTRSYAYREAAPEQWKETLYGPPEGPSWRDATTAGELWDGIKASFARTYDRLTPMTDLLQRRVGREPGARAQRADETATKLNQLDFEKYVVPIEPIAKQWDNNPEFRRMSLYYSEGSISRPEFIKYIKSEFGEKAANDMNNYLKWSIDENEKYNIGIYGQEKKQEYLHRQRILADNEDANKLIEQEISSRLDEPEVSLPLDVGNISRKVNVKWEYDRGDKGIINNYQNIFLTNTRRIMNNRKIFQYAEKFGVKGADNSNTPEEVLMKIRREIVKRGISPERADFAVQEIRRNLLGERKMMNSVLQALQTLGYAGSLAGPKSALLNIHDIPQTAVNQGPRAVRSWFQGIVRDKNGRMLSDSFGFSQQSKFGEFANSMNQTLAERGGMARSLNNTANKTTDTLMKASLFQLSDKIGKGGVLRSVQQRAVDDVQRGGWQELKKKWGTYFSDNELKRMAADLQRHGMDDSKYSQKGMELIEELMMAGLGQQQLISAGGRPAFWADHPNARIFLALRGFAMKQQAVALRNTLQNAKEGNVQEAKDWAIRYALYSMGGFAVINEGRQILFGDGDPSSRRMIRSFFDQLVGVASLNSASISDYSWGKIQRGEFLDYVLANNVPIAVGVPAEAVEDMFDVLTGEKEPSQLPETLPLFKQTQNLKRNIEELNEPGMLTSSN